MFAFALEHWALLGIAAAAIAAFVGVGMLGAWPLVLNRRVIGALALVLAAVAAALWWEHIKAEWMAEGARAIAETNRKARDERHEAIAEYVVASSQRAIASDAEQRRIRSRLELEQLNRPKGVGAYVTPKADAACIVPDGFVRYHDAAVPRADGRPALPGAASGSADRPSGVQLSRIGSVVAGNYDACQELLERVPKLRAWCATECAAWDARWGTKSDCARRCTPQIEGNPPSTNPKGR